MGSAFSLKCFMNAWRRGVRKVRITDGARQTPRKLIIAECADVINRKLK